MEDLIAHTVLLKDETVSSFVASTVEINKKTLMHEIGEDVYNAFQYTSIIDDAHLETFRDIIIGQAVRSTVAAKRCRGCVVVQESSEHSCNANCDMKEIGVHLFRINKDRIHVCVNNIGDNCITCSAPFGMHKNKMQWTGLQGTIYLCDASNRLHVCTPEKCKEKWIRQEQCCVCPLTGKVMTTQDDVLSHGWIEDNWRYNNFKKHKQLQASRLSVDNIDTVTLKTLIEAAKVLNERLKEFKQAQILNNIKPLSILEKEKLKHVSKGLNKVAFAVTKSLFPCSHCQMKQRQCFKQKLMLKFLNCTEKYIRNCHTNGRIVSFHRIECIHQNVWTAEAREKFEYLNRIEFSKMITASENYAKLVVKYYLTLVRHTAILKSDLKFTDFIVGVLYLQSTRFRVSQVDIFTNDVWLRKILPVASDLRHYPHVNTAVFTNAKNTIQQTIAASIDGGTNAVLLKFPLCGTHELFKI